MHLFGAVGGRLRHSRAPMSASQLQSRPNSTHPPQPQHPTPFPAPQNAESRPLRLEATTPTLHHFVPSRPPPPLRLQAHSQFRLGRRPTRPDTGNPQQRRAQSRPFLSIPAAVAFPPSAPCTHAAACSHTSTTAYPRPIGNAHRRAHRPQLHDMETVPLPTWRGSDPSASGWAMPDNSAESKGGSASL